MPIEASKFNNKGLAGSRALGVGMGIATGNPYMIMASAAPNSPAGEVAGAIGSYKQLSKPGQAQVNNDVNTMNQEISNPAGGEQMLGPDAMQRRLDAFTPDQLQSPEIGSSYNNAMNRRLNGFSL